MRKSFVLVLAACFIIAGFSPVAIAEPAALPASTLLSLTHNCPNTGIMLPKAFNPLVNTYLEPSDFVPSTKPQDTASLDDDTNLTGKSITKFSFRGVEQPVVSWIDMYMQVLGILHHENRAVLARLALERDDSIELSSIVTNKPEDSKPYSLLSDGIYVMTRTSTQYKIALLRRFFSLFEVDPSDLVFYMSEDERQDDDDSRHDLRYRYWSLALPEIQKGFRRIGATCYSNTNPTRMNWLPGYLGYSGINISCIGNLDALQVELYIGTPDAGKNKGIFDYLHSRKDSIEQIALQSLIWNRGDDKKTSKIYVFNDQLRIQNEDNWPQAIAWHIKNSTLLYQAIKPMLAEYYGF